MYCTLTWGVCAWAAASSCSGRRGRRGVGGSTGGGGPRRGGRTGGTSASCQRRRRRARLHARAPRTSRRTARRARRWIVARRAIGALGGGARNSCARVRGGQLASGTSGSVASDGGGSRGAGRRRGRGRGREPGGGCARQPRRLDVDTLVAPRRRRRHLGAASTPNWRPSSAKRRRTAAAARPRQLAECVGRRRLHASSGGWDGWTVVAHHRPTPSDDHWSENEQRASPAGGEVVLAVHGSLI